MIKQSKNCQCTAEETTGWTVVKCCNICGLPIKGEIWDFENGWINADFELPKVNCKVLVFHESIYGEKKISISYFEKKYGFTSCSSVSHWRYLPEIPES